MRNTTLPLYMSTVCLVFLPGCGGDHDAHTEGDGHDHGEHSVDDGHGHDVEQGAAPGEGDEHDHVADSHPLGSVTAAGTTLSVTSEPIEAGAEVDVELERTSGAVPSGIRVWFGRESGVGSLKAKADGHDGHFHARVELPEKLDSQARLWIQVESASGEKETTSLPLPSEIHEG